MFGREIKKRIWTFQGGGRDLNYEFFTYRFCKVANRTTKKFLNKEFLICFLKFACWGQNFQVCVWLGQKICN